MEMLNVLTGTRDRWFRPSDVKVAPDGSLIVADWYDPLWYSRSPTNNPSGPSQGVSRVLRGGAFGNPPWEVRAVHRHSGGPDGYAPDHGFRCAR